VIRASIDDFHREAAARYRRGRDSPEGYFHDSFDLPTLRARLLDPLGPGGSLRFRSKAFDYRSDRPVEPPEGVALPDTILLFDGVFLQRPELSGCFELTIFLDVPFEVTVARMVARDGGPPGVEDPGNRRYVSGQRIYLADCRPRERANLVVDNRDLQQPHLVRDDGRLAREPA
jgi:uridine kinase